ncbi:cation transporter [Candidatus Micrarchaeota archaeon]|nr:cation transporter [Candidatus Micrarchaeota archaeon]
MEKSFLAYNLTCDSCRELIGRAVSKFPGASLKNVDLSSGAVVVDCNESDFDKLKAAVYEKGFGPTGSKSIRHVVKGVLGNDSAFAAERTILEYSLGSLVLIFAVELVLGVMFFQDVKGFWTIYAPLLFLLAMGIEATVAAMAHLQFFKTDVSGMTGMMIGMTIGMASGFMLGALVGATNGMFIGSLAGMFVGMALGAWAGKCCGVMGVMEGMMAGLMSGTMGAMLSVMMFREPIMVFLVLLVATCVIMLAGLSYAIFKESGNIPQEAFKASFVEYAAISLIISIAFTLLMLVGPKSAVVIGV